MSFGRVCYYYSWTTRRSESSLRLEKLKKCKNVKVLLRSGGFKFCGMQILWSEGIVEWKTEIRFLVDKSKTVFCAKCSIITDLRASWSPTMPNCIIAKWASWKILIFDYKRPGGLPLSLSFELVKKENQPQRGCCAIDFRYISVTYSSNAMLYQTLTHTLLGRIHFPQIQLISSQLNWSFAIINLCKYSSLTPFVAMTQKNKKYFFPRCNINKMKFYKNNSFFLCNMTLFHCKSNNRRCNAIFARFFSKFICIVLCK